MAVATGQITIVDLNDAINLQGYLQTTRPKVQFLEGATYTPNWVTGGNIIEAQLFKSGSGSNIIQSSDIDSISWYYQLTGDANKTAITVDNANFDVLTGTNGKIYKVTILTNVMSSSGGMTIFCDIVYNAGSYTVPVMTTLDFSLSVRGDTGATGASALTIYLTNENHSIPTDSAGANGVYTNSGTNIYLLEGTSELQYDGVGTSNGSWNVTALGTNITPGTKTDSGNYATFNVASAMTADTAYITYTISGKRADGTSIGTIIKVQNFNKAKAGATATRTAILEMYQWAASVPTTFPSGTNSTYTWSTGLFTLPGTPASWTLLPGTGTAGQTLWVTRQIFSDSNTSDTSSVEWSSNTAYAAGGFGTSGVNGARTAILTMYKWSDTSPASYPALSSTYTWATGQFTDPGTLNGWSRVPTAIVQGQTLWGIQQVHSDTDTTATTSVSWTSSSPYPISFAGASAQYVVINGEQSFKFLEGQSTPVSNSIVLTAGLFGGLTTYDWEYWDGDSWENLSGTQNTSSYTLDYNNAAWGASTSLRVRCLSGTTQYDEITILKLYDGTNTTIGYLTNESMVIPTDVNGSNYTLTDASGTFKIFNGITDKTTSSVFSILGGVDGAGTYTKTLNGLTLTINETDGTYTLSGVWTSDKENFTLNGVYNGVTVSKIYSIAKSKQGAVGTPAQYVTIAGDYIFKYLSGSATPVTSSSVLTASLFGGLSGYDWEYWDGDSWENLSGTQNTSSYTLDYNNAAWGSATSLRIRCLSGSVYDEIVALKVYDGTKAVVPSVWSVENGTVFKNSGDSEYILVQADLYEGGTVVATPTSYTWYYQDASGVADGGGWVSISTVAGQYELLNSNKNLKVYSAAVASLETYRCKIVYNGNEYRNTISLIDQTDPFQIRISSTNGDVFKNSIGNTILKVILFRNGLEVDSSGATYVYNWSQHDVDGNLVTTTFFKPIVGSIETALGVTATQASAGTSVTLSASSESIVAGKYYVFGSETFARKISTVVGTAVTLEKATSVAFAASTSIKPITDNMKSITVTAEDINEKSTYFVDVLE